MRKKSQVVFLALLAVGLLTVPIAAHAGACVAGQPCLELTLQTGSTTFDSGLMSSPINDTNMTFGNFTITIQGTGLPTLTLPTLLDLFNLDITSSSGGTLTIVLTEINIPVPAGSQVYTSEVGGTQSAGSTMAYSSCFDSANGAGKVPLLGGACGGGTNPLFSHTFTTTNYSGSGSGVGNNNGAGCGTNAHCYSLTDVAVITMNPGSVTSFDGAITVPEPATLSVLGAGLLALGTGLRRKLLRG